MHNFVLIFRLTQNLKLKTFSFRFLTSYVIFCLNCEFFAEIKVFYYYSKEPFC